MPHAICRIVVYLEEIISGHSRLTGNTSRDYDSVGALEGFCQGILANMPCYFRGSVDVRQICGHSGSIDDIVQSQVRDQIRLLQQERQGLTNSTSSTADNDFFFVRI